MVPDMGPLRARERHRLLYKRLRQKEDARVKDWLLMRSPWPIFFIITTYLLLITLILPAYMRKRQPYGLRNVIKWYNITQIVSNAVVTWGILTSGWLSTDHFICWLPDYSTEPEQMRMLQFLWWTIILKLMELVETILFVLRKKERQVSFLHVYHHVSTVVMIWTGTKYVGGGMTSFAPMINNAMHVIMYSYYLLSSEGSPTVKTFLSKHKKWITVIQMVQIMIMFVYSAQVFLPSCPAPLGVTLVFFPSVIIVYFMFYDFFKKNYGKKSSKVNNGSHLNSKGSFKVKNT